MAKANIYDVWLHQCPWDGWVVYVWWYHWCRGIYQNFGETYYNQGDIFQGRESKSWETTFGLKNVKLSQNCYFTALRCTRTFFHNLQDRSFIDAVCVNAWLAYLKSWFVFNWKSMTSWWGKSNNNHRLWRKWNPTFSNTGYRFLLQNCNTEYAQLNKCKCN